MHVGILGTPWIGPLTLFCAVLSAGCSCDYRGLDECGTKLDCPANFQCDIGLFGSSCNPEHCSTHTDCEDRGACIDFKCAPCTSNSDCEGDVCDDSKCRPCVADKDCSTGEMCIESTCQGVCRADSDCEVATICENLACVRGCRDDSRCRPGTVCKNSFCVRPCSANSDCVPGWVCDNSICVASCRSNADCALEAFCKSGLCILGCRSASECGPDGACKDGTCVAIGIGEGCISACCPEDPACYSDPALGRASLGAECLATRDNTGQDHIQLRQQWIRATTPASTTSPLVYGVLAGRTQLPWKACNQTGVLGSGGYIQLVDFFLGGADKAKHYSTVGYAQYVPGPATGVDPTTFVPTNVLTNGFCFGRETYAGGLVENGNDYGLTAAEVGDGVGYPPGLPKPMAVNAKAWEVKPTKAKRLDADFDLTAAGKREELLAMFDAANPTSIAKDGYGGVFYYDDATGVVHGFTALSWTVIYDPTGKTHVSMPVREVETKSRFNDRNAPNCIGAYHPDTLDPATCQAGLDPMNPPWGGGDCTVTTGNATCLPGEAPASTVGYVLISELEQIYSNDSQATLCVTYPGTDAATSKPLVDAQGFYDSARASCKTAKWNPSDPVSGLPNGDWCAATNSAATSDCHDAWRTSWFHVFAGAKIRLDTNDTPATCPF